MDSVLQTTIDDFLDDDDDKIAVESKELFRINTFDRLQWYAKKIALKKQEIALVKKNAASIVETLEREIESFKGFFDLQVQEFLISQIPFTKKKSHNTLYGRVGIFEYNPVVKISDEEALLEFCAEHKPEFVISETQEVKIRYLSQSADEYFKELKPDNNGELQPVHGAPGTEFQPARTEVRLTAIAEKKPRQYDGPVD